MICPDRVRMFVRESLCRTLLRIRDPKLVLPEGNFKKGSGQWDRSIGPGPRAHMGLGISVSYNYIMNCNAHTKWCECSFDICI